MIVIRNERRTILLPLASQRINNSRPDAERRLRARLRQGPQSHWVVALAATGQLGMAAARQIRLAQAASSFGVGGAAWGQR
jgi:hypothetical protein